MFGQDKDANGKKMFTPISVDGSTYVNVGGLIPINVVTLHNADLPTDPLMPDLEDTVDLQDTGIFSGAYDDEVEGAEADFNNLKLTTVVSPIPITRIYKDHPKEKIIGDALSANQTRRMTRLLKNMIWIDAQEVLDEFYEGAHFLLRLQVMQKVDGIFIGHDKYMADILKKFDFSSMKTASNPRETNKALLKDEEAEDVMRLIQVTKIDTDHNVADLLTKAFAVCRDGISIELKLKMVVEKVSTAEQKLVLNGCLDWNETVANDEIQAYTFYCQLKVSAAKSKFTTAGDGYCCWEERLARLKEEETSIALDAEWDNTQAMMDADCKLATRLQEEKREELTIEEKSRSKPPTKAQKRNQMCTYLKNMANYNHNKLKNKSFKEIQVLFNNTIKWIEAFIPMDTKLVKVSDKAVEGSEKAKECSFNRAESNLEQEEAKRQRLEEENESAKLKRCLEIFLKMMMM
nr:hypothetical protein [Tanacetum cinerariifolium]